jgi:hypothetical protein
LPRCNFTSLRTHEQFAQEQILTRSDQIVKREESDSNRMGKGARPKPQFLLANSNLWAEVAETMPTAA